MARITLPEETEREREENTIIPSSSVFIFEHCDCGRTRLVGFYGEERRD